MSQKWLLLENNNDKNKRSHILVYPSDYNACEHLSQHSDVISIDSAIW